MDKNVDINNYSIAKKLWIRNYSLSILIHFIMLILLMLMYNWSNKQAKINSIMFSLDTKEYQTEKTFEQINELGEKENQIPQDIAQPIEEIKTVSLTDLNADTTNLDQLYSESTLNVKIKYPKGWTYLDQNKNKKLEGVTFWANDGSINPPPYIHLEVVSKDMFIEKRYKYKTEIDKYAAFYNDPEETQGYLTLVIYIRTGDEEDFRLKLMIKGKNEFESFQPKFWAIVKSFEFGKSFF